MSSDVAVYLTKKVFERIFVSFILFKRFHEKNLYSTKIRIFSTWSILLSAVKETKV